MKKEERTGKNLENYKYDYRFYGDNGGSIVFKLKLYCGINEINKGHIRKV